MLLSKSIQFPSNGFNLQFSTTLLLLLLSLLLLSLSLSLSLLLLLFLVLSIYRSPKVHQVGRPELAVIARGRRWEHRRSNRGTCPRCGAPGNRSNSTNDRGRIPTSLSHAGKKLYWFVYCTFCIYHICILSYQISCIMCGMYMYITIGYYIGIHDSFLIAHSVPFLSGWFTAYENDITWHHSFKILRQRGWHSKLKPLLSNAASRVRGDRELKDKSCFGDGKLYHVYEVGFGPTGLS